MKHLVVLTLLVLLVIVQTGGMVWAWRDLRGVSGPWWWRLWLSFLWPLALFLEKTNIGSPQ